MGWLIFWVVVVAYWAVGIKRLPVYYRRRDEEGVWDESGVAAEAIAMALFWPYYEAGRWVLDTVIRTATAEQRKLEEYEKAARIVEEYTKNKERRDQEEFDRKLRGLD